MGMSRPAPGTERHEITTTVRVPSDLGLHIGAGEGNRTLMTSLEGRWCRNRPVRSNVPAGLLGRVSVNDPWWPRESVACGPSVARARRPAA